LDIAVPDRTVTEPPVYACAAIVFAVTDSLRTALIPSPVHVLVVVMP
jgi:hypothetical protein